MEHRVYQPLPTHHTIYNPHKKNLISTPLLPPPGHGQNRLQSKSLATKVSMPHPYPLCIIYIADQNGKGPGQTAKNYGQIMISSFSMVMIFDLLKTMICTFYFHVANVYKRCSNLTGWILRTFNTRETISMMTLFKSLVLSRLDYASQLWSPDLLKSIYLIEKVQRSFTKHITGIKNKQYDERLKRLNLYSVQRRRDRYQIIYLWK